MSQRESQAGAPRRLVRAEGVLAKRRKDVAIVLEDAHDKHNISAVLRTCEAFGIQHVHIANELQDMIPINKGVSMGSHRWLSIKQHPGARSAIDYLRQKGYALYVGVLEAGARSLPHLPRQRHAAYVFGNENAGLSRAWLEAADASFVIPTSGFSGSLNLSVAVALTIYDRLLGQANAELPQGNLDPEEKSQLRRLWYESLAHGSEAIRARYAAYLEHPPRAAAVFPEDQHGGPRRR